MTKKDLVIADQYNLGRLKIIAQSFLDENRVEGVEVSAYDNADEAKEKMLRIKERQRTPAFLLGDLVNNSTYDVYTSLEPEQRALTTIVTRNKAGLVMRFDGNSLFDTKQIRIYEKTINTIDEKTANEIFGFYFRQKPTDIVYAEDHDGLRVPTSIYLKNYIKEKIPGAELIVVEDGKKALNAVNQLVEQGRKPVLITDYEMPNMNGAELYKAVLEDIQGAIVTTGKPDEFSRSIGDAPTPIVLVKPVDIGDLKKTLDELLGK